MWKTTSSPLQQNSSSSFSKGQPTSSNNMGSMRGGVLDIQPSMHTYNTPKMENNDFFIVNSQNTDSDDRIGEWLANEEASLDRIPMNYYEHQEDNKLFHQNQELKYQYNTATINNNFSNRHTVNNNRDPVKATLPVLGNTELRPISEIPQPFNSIFKFGVFNIIQSKCLDDTFYENNNLVISAPTGSGKTVLMELAIIRALLNYGSDSKIIYMAPTKSLCSERAKDWENKFKPFGIECKEFTGDTHFTSVSSIRKTTIIVTTPEKWDAMTRRWTDHKQLMQLISLFLIDEVHILNEKRGACLEACVSRMQTMGHNLRYIAVSATVPNLQDIATWLKAKPISFSEEYRPIKLERFAYGYPQVEQNMFLFDRKLDWKLLDMIEKHSHGKPVLIFCSTRKSAQQSSETILKMMDKKNLSTLSESGKKLNKGYKFKDKLLPVLTERGIAFHHAGLDLSDRSQIENMFLAREIRVIATTSTLAVGVNLPAHLVIIKSTQGYQNGSLSEYSDIDLLQMIGRAGRPGLDTSGCAVIMTTLQMKRRYNALISGTTNLESRLHENLIEYLASEICLGTITDITTALSWLRSTFLYVRMTKNPTNYRLEPASYLATDNILQDICLKDLQLLEEHKLIEKSPNLFLKATLYGLAMDRYYIKYSTMVRILEAGNPNSVKDTLELVSQSQEEMDMVRYNAGEKQFLNTLKNNANIRFPIDKVSSVADKIFILIQCVLGDISLYNSGNSLLVAEASNIMNNVSRIVKCLIDCSVHEKNSIKLKYAHELYQSLQARIWSISPYVARQVEGIGPQHAKTLAKANLISMEQLRNCDPGRLEVILHRNPPFGTKLKKSIDSIPHFLLNVEQSRSLQKKTSSSNNEFITLHITIGLANIKVNGGKYGKEYYAQFWIDTSEKNLLDFRRILISKLHQNQQQFDIQVEVTSPNMVIFCHLKSEDYVGVDVTKEIKANVDPRRYITLAGSSNISNVQIKEPEFRQSSSINHNNNSSLNALMEDDDAAFDAAFDDEFALDPQFLAEVVDMTKVNIPDTPKTNPQKPGSTSTYNRFNNKWEKSKTQEGETKKKQPKKKKSDELCKHRCKHKETCAHACCKLHVTSDTADSNVGGIKRISPDDDESLQEIISQKKKLKRSPSEESDTMIPSISSYNSNMGISSNPLQPTISKYHPQQSAKAVELSTKEQDDMIGSDNAQQQNTMDDDDMFSGFFDFDDVDVLDCIESMSNLESRVSTMDIGTGRADADTQIHQDAPTSSPTMTNIQPQEVEYSDPCDILWHQAGQIVQEAFASGNNDYPSNTTGNRLSSSGGSSRRSSVSRDIDSSGIITNNAAASKNKGPMNKEPLFQSSSISEWIQNYVEIIYDDDQM